MFTFGRRRKTVTHPAPIRYTSRIEYLSGPRKFGANATSGRIAMATDEAVSSSRGHRPG